MILRLVYKSSKTVEMKVLFRFRLVNGGVDKSGSIFGSSSKYTTDVIRGLTKERREGTGKVKRGLIVGLFTRSYFVVYSKKTDFGRLPIVDWVSSSSSDLLPEIPGSPRRGNQYIY